MHQNVFSLITGRLALATLLLAACATEAFGQLDERWSVTINGQTVRVESDGSFLLSNIAAPDLFGPGGPGMLPDFLADDVYRLSGARTTASGTLYVYSSNAIRITPGGVFSFQLNSFVISPFPPPLPESIALQVGCDPAAPTECGSIFTAGDRRALMILATFAGSAPQEVTLPSPWTTYRSSNANIARIVGDDPDLTLANTINVIGISPGDAFITATDKGATSVVKVTVAYPGDLISTTVEGFVRNTKSEPVDNASITVQIPTTGPNGEPPSQPIGTGTSDATGYFAVGVNLPLSTTPEIFADATITVTGKTESGISALAEPVPDGITDVGIITIDNTCDEPWATAFGPTTFEGFDIFAMAVFDDDGTGPNPPALFVAGNFSSAGGTPANNIAKWDGQRWHALVDSTTSVDGVNDNVFDLAVIDLNDGLGEALYAVGAFQTAGGTSVNRVAKWNGRDWMGFGIGIANTPYAVAAYDDDGNGPNPPALFVGGDFFQTGDGTPANRLAKWNPATGTWSAIGVGIGIDNGIVLDLAVFNDGTSSSQLYIGGDFFVDSNPDFVSIAKWDGTTISRVGYDGLGGAGRKVTSLVVFDDGSGIGTALYAGGTFSDPKNSIDSSVILRNMARWDGAVWSALGNSLDGEVLALAGLDDGVSRILYASGQFSDVNIGSGANLRRVAQWNGTAWSSMGNGIESTGTALTVFDDGNGAALYVGGKVGDGADCDAAGGGGVLNEQGYVAKWDAPEWSVLSNGLNDEVKALVVHDDGSGTALYAGGSFIPSKGPCDSNESNFPSSAVARFDGVTWSSLGSGMDCTGIQCVASVNALANFDEDGAEPNPPLLFAGGDFVKAGNSTANNVARWDGTNWSAVGSVGGIVESLAVFNDGANGSALYAGGVFPGGIKMWDGAVWTTIGGGVNGGSVFAMDVFDDGSGPKLYVGGDFTDAGNVPGTANLARWDGSAWSAVGGIINGSVHALYVFDDGSGSALYVGGDFLTIGTMSVNRIAKLDNAGNWSGMDNGLGANRVDTLMAFGVGQGLRLYAGGDFTMTTGGVSVNHLAKWTGSTWIPVGLSGRPGNDPGGGVTGTGMVAVQALAVFDDGVNGPALFTGGAFDKANGIPSSNIAKLGCR